ncbi:UNVERIFIED_CONTAM: hypothetical protein Sradi_2110400 [Sesamum radiatum]|uniref:Uncharacterized protein n=1 Tax=Sesamum radiatum TaxID=300843 RepID=A0AAW2TM52_SESRA
MAAKLTASTSSAQMLTSVLSSLVAEEAASMTSGLKRPKLEKPMIFPDANNSSGANSGYFPASTQSMSQVNPLQAPFLPPPPPPPLAPPSNSPANQLVQSTMMGFHLAMVRATYLLLCLRMLAWDLLALALHPIKHSRRRRRRRRRRRNHRTSNRNLSNYSLRNHSSFLQMVDTTGP